MSEKLLQLPKVQAIRSKLWEPYRIRFDALCEVLDGTPWRPYCGLRSFAEQDALWQQGRNIPGKKIVTQAKGGESPHNYGCASDWFYPKDGQDSWSDAPWDELGFAAAKVGLRWGGGFMMVDKPHVELNVSCSWKEVGRIYKNFGEQKAYEMIKSRMII